VIDVVADINSNGITFAIEDLSKPSKLLNLEEYNQIYKNLFLTDAGLSRLDNVDFQYDIVAKSDSPDSLINYGYHSFFNGMYAAYADHRPFVLSPDMIWLLISQGFSRHVAANSEKLRHHFVKFQGKTTLTVTTNEDLLNNPDYDWNGLFRQFTDQIAEHTGNDLINMLTADFSTTTSVEKIASEITIMEMMKPYFEYVVFYAVCGIPEITLLGNTEDWQKVLDKTKMLSKYDLSWWTDEIIPLLKEFVKASQGKVDKSFWQNMFKYHSQKKYGAPNIIDGWIIKFFPYDKYGKRHNLKELIERNSLPQEIIKADLKYVRTDNLGNIIDEIPLELWAGFIGLEQNKETFALTPKISWMIKKKDITHEGFKAKLASENNFNFPLHIRVKDFPSQLLAATEIKNIVIDFTDRITIPDEFAKVKIEGMTLNGKISQKEIEHIVALFPSATIKINDKYVNNEPEKELESYYSSVNDLQYKQMADSILKSKMDSVSMKSIAYSFTRKGFYKPFIKNDDTIIASKQAVYFDVYYCLKNHCGQEYGYKFEKGGWTSASFLNFTFDEYSNIVREPDYDFIKKIILPYDTCYMSLKEAQKIAKNNIQGKSRATYSAYLLNDYSKGRVVWNIKREKGFMSGTVEEIEIDTATGNVLDKTSYAFEKKFLEALLNFIDIY
jgi:hypothetical protein